MRRGGKLRKLAVETTVLGDEAEGEVDAFNLDAMVAVPVTPVEAVVATVGKWKSMESMYPILQEHSPPMR